jgi:predicted transport protein
VLFLDFRRRIFELGDDIGEKATSSYVGYLKKNRFAEVHILKKKIQVLVKPADYPDPNNEIIIYPESNNWAMDRGIYFDSREKLNYAMNLVKISYETFNEGSKPVEAASHDLENQSSDEDQAGEKRKYLVDDADLEREISVEPYRKAEAPIDLKGQPLPQFDRKQIKEWILEILAVESPLHKTALEWRICELAGIGRAGNQVTGAIHEAAKYASRRGELILIGDFLFLEDHPVPIRSREDSGRERNFEFISKEEFQVALIYHLKQNDKGALPHQEASKLISGSFGFGRATAGFDALFGKAAKQLVSHGVISSEENDDQVVYHLKK